MVPKLSEQDAEIAIATGKLSTEAAERVKQQEGSLETMGMTHYDFICQNEKLPFRGVFHK